MNEFARFTLVTLCAVGLLGGCGWSNNASAQGTIKFAENSDGGGRSCSFAFPDAVKAGSQRTVYNLINVSGCTDDVYSYFQLDSVQSATLVEFNSDTDCPRSGSTHNEWWYEVKTYKQPTVTGWVSIPALNSSEVGNIVTAGLLLTVKHHNFGDVEAELECVAIVVSELP